MFMVDKKLITANAVFLTLLLLYLIFAPTKAFLSAACPGGCRDLSGLALFGIWLAALIAHPVIGLPVITFTSWFAKRKFHIQKPLSLLIFSSLVSFLALIFILLFLFIVMVLVLSLLK
ncbi:hypothetical protein A2397_02380 [Candidatus Amesbacteria bacterium RIFOXYB1_FULL_44_23]|uniref:Uncharacterized protein n=1 Tax=Candidatus Amesbacteria bacterium RIFOXYB1_FULL_44_23 TaxID=1797263 RepID=A0A1F4ZTH0_9BACT|nr:MAG: hypothetical protein A2397_02380 [Candidatus Amesbacteria bacterium RIFOXYB1_FULL_44_23]